MTVKARKRNIIDKVKFVSEDWLLKSLEKLLADVEVHGKEESSDQPISPDLLRYSNKLEKHVDLEKLVSERPLKPLDMQAFAKAADALEWDKSIDELLEDLK